MLQIIQYQKTGEIFVEEFPAPRLREGGVLVLNVYSLISPGTERASLKTAKSSMLGKAKSRPDLTKQVLDNVKKEGLRATYKKVKSRLDSFKALGYSSAGVVLESSVPEFREGDRVACAGGGYASHAEIIFVPKNMVAKIPDNVKFDEACFSTLGAIALQGIRQAEVHIGESVAVIGLGLLGLITVQLLKANGCRVIGLDINEKNFKLAEKLECDCCVLSNSEAIAKVESFTLGYGTDAIIITAATKSNEPIELSLQFARKKSKVVVVGGVKMNIPRSPFYEKEVDLRISCSYGPGRYDSQYEEKGIDYPIGYVRWTEKRNIEAILDLLSQKKIDFKSLITHKIPIEKGLRAYDILTGKIKERHLGILIEYPYHERSREREEKTIILNDSQKPTRSGRESASRDQKHITSTQEMTVGFIGAGNFAQSYLLPPLKKLGIRLKGVATLTPVNAKLVGKRFNFEYCTSDANKIIEDDDINLIFIATRHDSHSKYVIEALKRGKHVFVEKPLAINDEQIERIAMTVKENQPSFLMVGYNRRFSEPINKLKDFFNKTNEPLVMTYRVNAGPLPEGHWMRDSSQGGRFVGEGCHFLDTMKYICGSEIVALYAQSIRTDNSNVVPEDNIIVTCRFDNESIGVLSYFATGNSRFPKEYLEVFGAGKAGAMNDFKTLELSKASKKSKYKFKGQKGHKEEMMKLSDSIIYGKGSPISFEGIYNTTLATFEAMKSLKTGEPQQLR